jgi:hypothetical protein
MLAATQGHGSLVLAGLIAGLIFAALSIRVAGRFSVRAGVSPWHLHPAIWGVIGFVLGLIGFLLVFVARATTRPERPGSTEPVLAMQNGAGPIDGQWAAPAWPTGPGAQPVAAAASSDPASAAPAPTATPPPADQRLPAYRSMTAIEPSFDPPGVPPAAYTPDAAPRGPIPPWPALPPAGTSPAWLPDPTGRDGYRYFDGARWTPFVHTRGGASVHHL